MSTATKTSRTQVWMDTMGDWTWPGQGGAAAEVRPPPWVPASPPRRAPVAAPAAPATGRTRSLLIAALLSALAAVCLALAAQGQLNIEQLLGISKPSEIAPPAISARTPAPAPLPTLVPY